MKKINLFLRVEGESVAKRSKGGNVPSTSSYFLPADVSAVDRFSKCFKGKEICVYNGTDEGPSKQELEKLIASGSGVFVQHPGNMQEYIVLDSNQTTISVL